MRSGLKFAVVLTTTAVLCAAAAQAASERHPHKWLITHLAAATTVRVEVKHPEDLVCRVARDEPGSIVAETTTNTLDLALTRSRPGWWALNWLDSGVYVPIGHIVQATTRKWHNVTRLTWGVKHEDPESGACTMTTATCTATGNRHVTLGFAANTSVSARRVKVLWPDWPGAMLTDRLCFPQEVHPGDETFYTLTDDGIAVHFRYAQATCCGDPPDPITKMPLSTWQKRHTFHIKLAGSGAKAKHPKRLTASAHYRLDAKVRTVFG